MGSCLPDAAVFDVCGVDAWLAVRFVDLEQLSMWIVKGDVGATARVSGLGFIKVGIECLCACPAQRVGIYKRVVGVGVKAYLEEVLLPLVGKGCWADERRAVGHIGRLVCIQVVVH